VDVELITNYLRITENLGTAGQPTPEQFAAIRDAGYEMVVNLAMPTSTQALPNERELVAAHGMEYVHIPVVWEAPTLADLEGFFQVMGDNQGKRVFVHCALNLRVSAFVLLYRVIRQGVPLEIATEMLHRIWQPEGTWHDFVQGALAHYGHGAAL
jgi:protein tyrosine phosphatase (PTP) superfamily phosphohydrolase (DUF442 family)